MGLWDRLGQRLTSLVDDIALPDVLRERMELGHAYFERGDLVSAEHELATVVTERPEYGRAWRLLGLVRWQAHDLLGAQEALERAGDAEALVALGDVYRETGDAAAAQHALRRALTLEPKGPLAAEAFRSLGELHLLGGRADKAVRELRKAAASDPGLAEVHALLGEAFLRLGEREKALMALRRAAAVDASGEVSRRHPRPETLALLGELLLELAPTGAIAEAEQAFSRLLEAEPSSVRARVGLGRVLLARGEAQGAHEATLRALAQNPQDSGALRLLGDIHEAAGSLEESLDVRLRAGQPALDLALKLRDPLRLAAHARRQLELRPADPLAGAALRLATEPAAAPPAELDGLLRVTQHLFLSHPALAALAPEAGRLVDLVDRPLLLAIMGEFNTGKSTFVNALVGEEVAAMGITPTTATLNVLKYGPERGSRLVYRDGRTEDVPWSEIMERLRRLTPAQAASIRTVELLFPSEGLLRVNIVDTPGLNALIPEHEEAASELLAQADAIVWLFAAGQAGKHTEADVLARARGEGKRVLGVLNKIDQLDEPAVAQVLAHLVQSLGSVLERLIPVSAKQALAGQGGRFAELRAALEELFFARSREIQRSAARVRLSRLLAQAQSLLPPPAQPRADERAQIDQEGARFRSHFLPAERVRLRAEADAAYRAAAREVIEFARPRTWPFGQHSADPADRDFLVELLEETIDRIGGASNQRAASALGPDATARLEGAVYGRLGAFARGYLRGGGVDAFFTHTLPHVQLTEEALARSLASHGPDLEEWLLAPLERAAKAHFAERTAALDAADRIERAAALDLERALGRPIEDLQKATQALAAE